MEERLEKVEKDIEELKDIIQRLMKVTQEQQAIIQNHTEAMSVVIDTLEKLVKKI